MRSRNNHRQGATTLGLPVRDFLARLKAAGLGSLPGTAAEVLDADVRSVLCPDKLSAEQVRALHCAAFAWLMPTRLLIGQAGQRRVLQQAAESTPQLPLC